jgi:glycosyltransferase involved in cell wall biosynthesis
MAKGSRPSAGTAARVSVITPVFNAGGYLERTLASVQAQTYRDFEMVIVDDGSTDSQTLRILEKAAGQPNVSVHHTLNRGPSLARNTAIERSRGRYVLPLDADDYLAPTFLEKTVQVLDEDPAIGVAYTWVGLVGNHHGVWRTGGFSLRELLSRCTIHVASLYRRALWSDVGGYDPQFVESCEDWDLWLGAAARGWTGAGVPEVLVYYRRTEKSREIRSRAPESSARLMCSLVAKHRKVYDVHLEEAMADMYQRLSAAGIALEKIYHHPAVRAAVRLRALFKRQRIA